MSYTRRTRRNEYYLDVSDFVLSDPRQVVPSPRRTPIQQINSNDVTTYCLIEVTLPSPNFNLTFSHHQLILDSHSQQWVQLSPYFSINGPTLDIQFYDFTLEIPEENEQNEFSENQHSQQNNQNYQKQRDHSIIYEQPIEEEIQSSESPEYTQVQISRYNLRYFNQAMTELKKMKATQEEIRQFVMEYTVSDNHSPLQLQTMNLHQLISLAHENLRPVGPISWLERKIKVSKYINKKKKRVWKKKISYDCRKRVADNRLRVKGKFVTRKQACNMLGVDQISEQDLKLLLEAKITKTSEL